MLITRAPKRCTQCKNILTQDEQEHRWCDRCRSKERDKNSRKKENREQRDQIASMFGYNRKEKRENK